MADRAHTTRRAFLKSAPLAAVAVSAPAMAIAIHETPEEKVRRLSDELSNALTDYDGGRWYAMIYPPESHPYPKGLGIINLDETQERKVHRLFLNLQYEMSLLPGRMGDGMRQVRLDPEGRSYARYMPQNGPNDTELLFAVMRPINT
jgi:hypothetical protein